MDKYSEVSWSEICRNAISQYIAQRKSPSPRMELNVRSSGLNANDLYTGYPSLIVNLNVQNNSNSEMNMDRILATARSQDTNDGRRVVLGETYFLYRHTFYPNSSAVITLRFPLLKEKLVEVQNRFASTFNCKIDCTVFVDGYANRYDQEVVIQIPIDKWHTFLKKALGTNQAT